MCLSTCQYIMFVVCFLVLVLCRFVANNGFHSANSLVPAPRGPFRYIPRLDTGPPANHDAVCRSVCDDIWGTTGAFSERSPCICGLWDADGHDAAGTQPVDASAVVLIDSITEHTDNYATKRGPQPPLCCGEIGDTCVRGCLSALAPAKHGLATRSLILGVGFRGKLSDEDISEIECHRVVAMVTNFGTKLLLTGFVWTTVTRQLVMKWVWVVVDRSK